MKMRKALKRAAGVLQHGFRDELARLGGELHVWSRKGIHRAGRTLVLTATVEFDELYEHIDIDVATRRWFSRHWREIRSVDEAARLVGNEIRRWVSDAQSEMGATS